MVYRCLQKVAESRGYGEDKGWTLQKEGGEIDVAEADPANGQDSHSDETRPALLQKRQACEPIDLRKLACHTGQSLKPGLGKVSSIASQVRIRAPKKLFDVK